ncbi:MAG: hypothetical protein ACQKBT_08645, partial [Puniceicoccales bacterium]
RNFAPRPPPLYPSRTHYMNGSKNILLLLILILALLPWGFLFLLLNSEDGAKMLGLESQEGALVGVTQEQVVEMEALIEEQKQEIAKLQSALENSQDDEALITPLALQELRDSVTELEQENRLAVAEIERLRTEYNSALSQVVQLRTQQMAAEAQPRPQPAPAPQPQIQPQPLPEPAPEESVAPPNPGGWILPPSN